MQSELNESATAAWAQLEPLLDEGMASLGDADRAVLALRYFENKTASEIGRALKLNEETAKKRASRALEKLRKFFTRRGVALTATAIASAMAANSVQAAPAAMGKAISAVAVAKGAAASSSASTLVQGALKLMAWHNAKVAVTVGAAMLLVTGAAPLLVEAVRPPAKAYPEVQGAWESVVVSSQYDPAVKPVKLHQVLKVSTTNDAYLATLDLIELGQINFPITAISYRNGVMHLQFNTWGYFEGTMDAAGTEIRGYEMSQAGRKIDLVWKRTTHPDVPTPPLAESEYAPAGNSVLQGFWEGRASTKGIPRRMDLKISEPSAGHFRAEADLLDTGGRHIPISIVYDKPTVKLTGWGIELEGRFNSSNTEFQAVSPTNPREIVWTFKRGHQEPVGNFTFAAKTELQGHWQGVLQVEGIKLPLSLHLAKLPNGRFSATLDDPGQGSIGALATAVQFRPPQVRIEWVPAKVAFEGKLENGKLSGVLNNDRGTLPVVFKRSDQK